MSGETPNQVSNMLVGQQGMLPAQFGNTANVPKLDGKNYQSWREMVTMILSLRGLGKALTERVDEMTDMQARLILLETMDESHRTQVRGLDSAKLVMERLKQVYADTSASNLFRMLHVYFRYNKPQGDSVSEHVGKMANMRAALADVGEKQSEELFQVALIASLPEEYGNILEVWEMAHPEMRTTQNLIGRLIKREEDVKKKSAAGTNEKLFIATHQTNKNLSIEEQKKVTRCANCNELGHWFRECPQPKRARPVVANGKRSEAANPKQAANPSYLNMCVTERPKPSVLFAVAELEMLSSYKLKWLADTGATESMCHVLSWFTEINWYDTPGTCAVGDGRNLPVLGKGTIEIVARIGDKEVRGLITDVLYMPGLATNLMSIGAAANKGVLTIFDKGSCQMVQKSTKQVVATGKQVANNLYLLDIEPAGDEHTALYANCDRSAEEWHKALGHPNEQQLRAVADDIKSKVVVKDRLQLGPCEECARGKAKRCSHPLRTSERESKAGVKIHVDLSGLVNKVSFEGFAYYLLCKDEATGFSWPYFLKDKTETAFYLGQMLVDSEYNSGQAVKAVFSDNGSEFVNATTRVLFAKERVVHERSAAYTPQQNGLVERQMQTINNTARTILNASGLPKELWPWAIETACYLRNRLPGKNKEASPYEKFTGKSPVLDHLVEFGQPAQVIINDRYLTKFDARTEEGHVVGFTARRNTYKVYIVRTKKVIITSDVIMMGKVSRENGRESLGEPVEGGPVQVYLAPNQSKDNQTEETNGEDEVAGEQEPDTITNIDEGNTSGAPYFTLVDITDEHRASTTRKNKEGRSYVTKEELTRFFEEYREQDKRENGDVQSQSERVAEEVTEDKEETNFSVHEMNAENTIKQLVETNLDNHESSEENPPPVPLRNESLRTIHQDDRADYRANMAVSESPSTPKTFKQALDGPNRRVWMEAIAEELQAHSNNQTWEVVDCPHGEVPISTKWVFTIKKDDKGRVERFKARLVARGFEQRRGVHFHEVHAPVAKIESLRAVLALSAIRHLAIKQFDVATAFLHGQLGETIYIEIPAGLEEAKNKCLRLNKALYGLKQAPRCWNSTFNQAMAEMGFKPCKSDPCVFKGGEIFVLVYVDDGLVIGPAVDACEEIIRQLASRFKIKTLSGNLFLGLELKISKAGVRLTQKQYILDTLERFNLSDANGVSTPIISSADLFVLDDSEPTKAPYGEAVGCLQYLAGRTRPDILFAANFLAKFNRDPLEKHWTAVKRVLKYLKQTIDLALVYTDASDQIVVYSDADWANDPDTRRSVSGVMVLLAGAPISYASRAQDRVAQSSTEAELLAANLAVRELLGLTHFLDELEVEYSTPLLRIDNRSTLQQIKNAEVNKRNKHIGLAYYNTTDHYQEGKFSIDTVASENQAADMLTKPVARERLVSNRLACGLFVNMAILCTLAMLGLLSPSIADQTGTINLEEASTIIVSLSRTRVVYRQMTGYVDYVQRDPCQLSATGNASTMDLKQKAYTALINKCQESYKSGPLATLKEVEEAFSERPQMKLRLKREPVTAVIGGAVGLVTAGGYAYSYWNSDSSYNRLNRMDISNTARDARINDLNSTIQHLQVDKNTAKDTTDLIEKNLKQVREAVLELPEILTLASWEGSTVQMRIREDTEFLRAVAGAARKGKMDVPALYQLTRHRDLKNSETDSSMLTEARVINGTILRLTFKYIQDSSDTIVTNLTGIRHWINVTTRPALMDYAGPKVVIYNSTSNCVRRIPDPGNQPRITATCTEQNYRDPDLSKWKELKGTPEELEELSQPIIYTTENENIIYCTYKNYTISDKSRRCPVFPFIIPIGASVSIPGYAVRAEVLNLTIHGKFTQLGEFNVSEVTDQLHERYLDMINQNKANHDQLNQPKTLSVTKDAIVVPFNLNSLFGLCSCLGLLIAIARCMWSRESVNVIPITPAAYGQQPVVQIEQVVKEYPDLTKHDHIYSKVAHDTYERLMSKLEREAEGKETPV